MGKYQLVIVRCRQFTRNKRSARKHHQQYCKLPQHFHNDIILVYRLYFDELLIYEMNVNRMKIMRLLKMMKLSTR